MLTHAPVAYAVSGFADARIVTAPQPAADAIKPGATKITPAQAGRATTHRASPTASSAACAKPSARPRRSRHDPQGHHPRGHPPDRLQGIPQGRSVGPEPERPPAASLALLPSTAAHADGIRAQQWALESLCTPSRPGAPRRARASRLAVLDTGVDDQHPDLAGNVHRKGHGRLRGAAR